METAFVLKNLVYVVCPSQPRQGKQLVAINWRWTEWPMKIMFPFYRPKSETSQANSYSDNLAINITFYWFPETGCSETTSSLLEASERACRGANQLHQSIINVWTLPTNVCKNQEEHCSLDRCDPHPLRHQCRRELSSSQLYTCKEKTNKQNCFTYTRR